MPTKRTSKPPMRTPKKTPTRRLKEAMAEEPGFAHKVTRAVMKASKSGGRIKVCPETREIEVIEKPPTDAMESFGDALGLRGLRRVASDDPIDMLGPLIDPIIEEDDDDDSPNVVETP